jgi:hypothetical protein
VTGARGLKNLQYLQVTRTQVSDTAVKELQAALPSCRIDR